jgi:hypothetical protein
MPVDTRPSRSSDASPAKEIVIPSQGPAMPEPRLRLVKRLIFWSVTSVVVLTLVTATGVGLALGVSAYSRAEQRANGNNRVRLARIEARREETAALAGIEVARANATARYEDAVGIRRAQVEISANLTAPYLQYEAIQAQQAVATSGRNNTLIYLPAGTSGVPLVSDPENVNGLRPQPAK